MANVPNHEKYAKLIAAFGRALTQAIKNEGSDAHKNAEEKAFALAKRYGWDAENDRDFMEMASKADSYEVIAFGLATAIEKI